jgi:hypothetical protein
MGQCHLPYRLSDERPRSMCQLGFGNRDDLPRYATFKERTCEGKICYPSLVDALEPRSGHGVSWLHRRSTTNNARCGARRRSGEARWRWREAGRAARDDTEGREEVKDHQVVRHTANPVRVQFEPSRPRPPLGRVRLVLFVRTNSLFVKRSSAGRPDWRARRFRRS